MKSTFISIGVVVILIGGAVLFSRGGTDAGATPQNNISIVDGKQIIEIDAKGGYLPRNSVAKANIPTVIKVRTNGTFDCSAALVIPSIGYRKNLPSSGETLIELPSQKEGSTLQGLCAMGMYNFSVKFN
ncbi:MAG: hypothetical protein A3C11_02645 [Candidatus Sungbacteria bacterium RIFCSPHIGHO2_02_FULL_49_12]|uniref:EfeO-type cupredoxin-like domain-containing protein n=1 Tax=Candidatus Sungbacteria bacterium RIFCSPHIGHO2_02_FULL_49_12 TaxID=1802271 RepID=A0A1G2KS35_9BACT|nr:MAG: hypothetical protein A3C11_02645 [Candidatus Sungbacteria bacterium RIFCSPHIGHO2_02_FULL_49_12]